MKVLGEVSLKSRGSLTDRGFIEDVDLTARRERRSIGEAEGLTGGVLYIHSSAPTPVRIQNYVSQGLTS